MDHTADGGFIVAGESYSTDFTGAGHSDTGPFLMKLDADGVVEWQRVYAGAEETSTEISSVQQTSDGGFVAVGRMREKVRRDTLNYVRLFKTDANGNMDWEQLHGGRPVDE